MIDVIIKMKLPADKRKEIVYTIMGLLFQFRRNQDCVSCQCCLDVEEDNVVIFEQQWKNNEALDTHLESSHFKILLEAMTLLSVELEIRVKQVVAREGFRAIAAQWGGVKAQHSFN